MCAARHDTDECIQSCTHLSLSDAQTHVRVCLAVLVAEPGFVIEQSPDRQRRRSRDGQEVSRRARFAFFFGRHESVNDDIDVADDLQGDISGRCPGERNDAGR